MNVVGSSVARETDAGVYNHAGPEIGVASTKAFLSQLTVLAIMSVFIGRLRGSLEEGAAAKLLAELYEMPDRLREVLGKREEIRALAKSYAGVEHCLFLGCKYQAQLLLRGRAQAQRGELCACGGVQQRGDEARSLGAHQ